MPDVKTVALVDDDPQVRRALERLLRTDGFHVSTFSSAEALLREFRAPFWDCIILDVHMEGMTGLDLCDMLADMSPRIPVVLITADHERVCVHAQAATALACLPKPIDIGALDEALARVYAGRGSPPKDSREGITPADLHADPKMTAHAAGRATA